MKTFQVLLIMIPIGVLLIFGIYEFAIFDHEIAEKEIKEYCPKGLDNCGFIRDSSVPVLMALVLVVYVIIFMGMLGYGIENEKGKKLS